MYLQEDERYTPYVARILSIEDITRGDGKQYLVRYRGRLRIESVQAYDQLTNLLRPLDITPMFRNEQGCHAIYLVTGAVRLRPSRIWVNILLLVI